MFHIKWLDLQIKKETQVGIQIEWSKYASVDQATDDDWKMHALLSLVENQTPQNTFNADDTG